MSRRLLTTILAMPVISITACVLIFLSSPSPRKVVAQQPQKAASRPDITGGTPGARKEIDDSIVRVGNLGLPDAFDSLNQIGEDYNLAFQGADVESYLGAKPAFLMVVADRRVAKIYEMLASLPPEEAAKTLTARFNADLARTQAGFEYWLRDPLNTIGNTPVDIHALSAELFLISLFCDLDTLLQAVHDWEDAMGPLGDAAIATASPPVVHWGTEFARPQPLLVMNIYLLYLQRHNCLNEEDIQGARRLGMVPLKNLVFTRWYAHTSQFDFTHKTRGVPVDFRNAIATFRSAYILHNSMLEDVAKQNELVDYWRQIVVNCDSAASKRESEM